MAAKLPHPVVLQGQHVSLSPTEATDAPALFDALADPEVWAWMPALQPMDVADMTALVGGVMAERAVDQRWPWTIRLHTGDVVGWTSFLDIQPDHEAIEIGWTSVGRPWWRSAVNSETKLLLLTHLFEQLGYGRVCLKTDIRNERSQAAIARLGAQREGVLRRHRRRPDGSFRDTVYFSLLIDEWPGARAHLARRLQVDRGETVPCAER